MSNCPVCNSEAKISVESFDSEEMDFQGHRIIVDNYKVHRCGDTGCGNYWVNQAEIDRVDAEIEKRKKWPLKPEEIDVIWRSLGCSTKTEAANFLNLNSKAFTKWISGGYSSMSASNDLLLRLAIFSKRNSEFIRKLHETNFKFDPTDYELICELNGDVWKYQDIEIKPVRMSNEEFRDDLSSEEDNYKKTRTAVDLKIIADSDTTEAA